MFTGNSPRVGAIGRQAGKSNQGITAILRRLAADSLTLLLITILASPSLPVSAADANAALMQLMKILRDRGSITEEEYQALKAAAQAEAPAAPQVVSTATNAAPTNAMPATKLPGTEPAVATPAPSIAAAANPGAKERPDKLADQTSSAVKTKPKELKWYEKIGFGGYTQLRYSRVLDESGADLAVPADRSVGDDQTFYLRRGRVKFSGDVTDHLYLYAQLDFAGSPTTGDFALQMRDLYADIAFDKKKEYRIRVGQSKVPYGWVNMQSSQNRAPMERADAINSAADGERDIGAFFMWAPEQIRARFKSLVKDGLKGSGDYGMVALGAYSGQGPNRPDKNDVVHVVARLSYPFLFENGQIMELGIQAYTGDYVVTTAATPLGTPAADPEGITDRRVGMSFSWYPQPFGIEGEFNFGEGPTLSDNHLSINAKSLFGGYIQANYRMTGPSGEWFPFVRWQYYRGGRKSATNAPDSTVNEIDVGFEWSPWPELELTASYTHTFTRTNIRGFPYADTTDADRVAFQVQLNY
jgi:hypothetical protein